MKLRLVLALTAAITGCSQQFALSRGATPPPGHTTTQVRADVLECQDQARIGSQTDADKARGVALSLSLSVVGYQIDQERQKSDQRAIYARCMTEKGYTVKPIG